jgi:hypothetical protein
VRDRFRAWRERRRRETPADREKRLRDRLERAVAAIKPQAARLLAKGTSPLLFRLRLAWWKVRHRLSGLSMDANGTITARINPTIELDNPKGRKVTEAELGALLTPIFRQAELKYHKSAAVRTPEREAAAARWRTGQAGALNDLSRAEQQNVLRRNQPGKRSMRAEDGVSVGMSTRSLASWQMGRVGMVPGPGDYRGMTARLIANGRKWGLSAADIAAALSTGRVDEAALLAKMQGGGPKGRQKFVESMRRVSFLVHVVEPARRRGHSVTAATAFSMLDVNEAGMFNVLEGSMAPMAPVGAASQRDTPQSRAAAALGQRRVGTVFTTLLEVTKNRPPLVSKSGADLSGLAEAIRTWLAQRLAEKPDPEQLAAARAELVAGIIRLLTVYYGRPA